MSLYKNLIGNPGNVFCISYPNINLNPMLIHSQTFSFPLVFFFKKRYCYWWHHIFIICCHLFPGGSYHCLFLERISIESLFLLCFTFFLKNHPLSMSNNCFSCPTKLTFSLVLLGRQSDTSIMPKMIRGRLKQVCVLINCFLNTNNCRVKQYPKGTQISVNKSQLRMLASPNLL